MQPKTYAFIKNNVVINTAIFEDLTEEMLNIFKNDFELDHIVLTVDTAEPGHEYDSGKVWPPSPYQSWIKNYEKGIWEAPVPKPDDTLHYKWDEESLSWMQTA